MYLNLSWSEKELEDLLDLRVRTLVKEEYTSQEVALRDLLPANINRKKSIVYILERTMYRPRDAIMFLNKCIDEAQDKVKISKEDLLRAEGEYSLDRLRALADEWSADYPDLVELAMCLKQYPSHFKKENIRLRIREDLFEYLTQAERTQESTTELAQSLLLHFYQDEMDEMCEEVLRVLYRVGLIGVKPEKYLGIHWSFKGQKVLHYSENSVFHFHPAFYRVLGISP